MDFLNKALGQLGDLFRSMTVGARITAGLLLTVVVVSLVWLFRYQASSPDAYLMNGIPLSASDITALEAAFADKGLKSWEVEGNRIRVPRGQKDQYMAAAAEKKALPRGFGGYFDEAINQSSMWDVPGQSGERLKNAKQKELARIISQMRGIETASVLLDAENKRGLTQESIKTGLVSVKPLGSAPLDESQVDSIRHLVAAAVAGLKYGNVKVVDENTGRTYYGDPESGAGPRDDPYYATKRLAEKQWTEKILSALPYVPGVTVAVNVELEKELSRREIEQKPDQKPVAIRRKENTRSRTRDGSLPGGRAGFQTNQPQALAQTAAKGSHEEEEETTTSEENFLGTTSVQKEVPGLTPTLVKASIGVPTSYFERVWRERNPPQAGEAPKTPTPADLDAIRTQEIAKIKTAVVGLLPQPEKITDPTQLVTVTEFQDITPEPTPAPGLTMRTVDWLMQNWSTLGLIFLGGFSLVVLRSVARAAPAAAPPRSASLALPRDLALPVEKTPEPQEAAPAAERRARRGGTGGASLRDELSEMVAEDPDAAAAILRTWIGNAR